MMIGIMIRRNIKRSGVKVFCWNCLILIDFKCIVQSGMIIQVFEKGEFDEESYIVLCYLYVGWMWCFVCIVDLGLNIFKCFL